MVAILLAAFALSPMAHGAMALAMSADGQAFVGAGLTAGFDFDPAASDAPDSNLYAEGTRAINQAKWADAAAIFAKVAAQQSAHADGALYWKAYAENKMGQSKPALGTCADLRAGYPKSRWLDECGALEIEIRAQSGQLVKPLAGESDEMKLLALNTMLHQDEPRALAEIQEILNGDASEKLKQEAQFILGQHYSDATYPQIVRVSYVEGDVRVTRGKEAERETGATWEKAEVNLPLETGFSLVTGNGRAEIELEDASTIYLGENSVLTFNNLETTAGIPYTEVALLTGTVTLHVKPYVAGEVFTLRTPTDELTTSYTNATYLRVTAFTDGTAITPQTGGVLRLPVVGTTAITKGQTQYYRGGVPIDAPSGAAADEFVSWDKWVTNRVNQRAAAMTAVMKASGLTKPIPGMAEMQSQGTFFPCAPYGTCWEPGPAVTEAQQATNVAQPAPPAAEVSKPRTQGVETVLVTDADTPARSMQGGSGGSGGSSSGGLDPEEFFPCYPSIDDYRTGIGRTLGVTGQRNPYDWAVCHAGTWIRHNRHYVWVAGHKRHHLPPVRWVKSGRTVAIVPLHPWDVKGRPPINLKEDIFAVREKNGTAVERVRFDPSKPIEMLKEPPKEFRAALPVLARAEEPRIEAHALRPEPGGKDTIARASIPIHFDHRTQTFLAPREEMHGNKPTTVFAPLNNRTGNLQARGGSLGGGSRGSSGGSGGGSHSSGGGSSGGGSHGSSGGSSSGGSSAGASSGGSGGSSSSSGGSHH